LRVDADGIVPYIASMRKAKNRAASLLAKRRWAGYTPEERREQLKKAWAGRSAQAAGDKARTDESEGVAS